MVSVSHQPVLLRESLAALYIRENGVYVDATFGRGGHSEAILGQLGAAGRLLAFDQDPEAIAYGHRVFAGDERLILVHDNFAGITAHLERSGLTGRVDGVLMDLGVSSPQLDDAARGFSFLRSGPLDMRMNPGKGLSARQWLARVERDELATVLKRFGEERFARRIATAIVAARQTAEIATTGELAEIIAAAVPVKEKNRHPATRSFQAIRIYINQELQSLEAGLEAALDALAVQGRLAVISFHSLEDRIVKRFMRDKSSRPVLPAGLPIMDADIDVPFRRIGKPVAPGADELAVNPRARSARLRVLERVT